MKQKDKYPDMQEGLYGFLSHEQGILDLENLKYKILGSTQELTEKLENKEINGIEYHILLNEKFKGVNKDEILKSINERIEEEKREEEGRDIKEEKIKEEDKKEEREEKRGDDKKRRTIIIGTAAILLILIAILSIVYTNPDALTGYAVGIREAQEVVGYNRVFDHYTETQLDFTNLTSLSISGELQGTRATVKLRIDGIEYIIADIVNEQTGNLITGLAIAEQGEEYALSTDKNEYALGETVYITVEPGTGNKSLYVSYGAETHKLDDSTYVTQNPGEHQAIALIVLPDDILRLETNFTVINETVNITINESVKSVNETINETANETINQTVNDTIDTINETLNETINQTTNETTNQTVNDTTNETSTTGHIFENLCLETCSLPEISNPVLIIELEEGSSLTLTELSITQNKENQAPQHTRTIPDITITTAQTANLNLDEYFFDPDGDTVHYDINDISEINGVVNQEILSISSTQEGTYVAYIYATDGDELITSNTFDIIVTQADTNATTNQTINITPPTGNETTVIIEPVLEPQQALCSHPNPNKRPPECIEGSEEEYFKSKSIHLKNLDRKPIGRITAFGNLVIEGSLTENSDGEAGSRDFRISYSLADGETEITTAWVETSTGDLHLRGNLYEEQFTLLSGGKDTFMIQNRKGTNLGYFDRRTGDLYLRGNLIEGRPETDVTGE